VDDVEGQHSMAGSAQPGAAAGARSQPVVIRAVSNVVNVSLFSWSIESTIRVIYSCVD
jgi:hypothetical protein